MTLARALGVVGRFFIGAGTIILLFVAYQLWGTNIAHDLSQGQLETELEELFAEAATISPVTSASPRGPTTTTTPESLPLGGSATEQVWNKKKLLAMFPSGGDAISRIEAPSIGLNEVVVEGVQVADLRKGPGHYRSTPLPGQPGNASIAGHRTTYGAPFHDIDQLAVGDEIVVTTVQGAFTYRVMSSSKAFPRRDKGNDAHTIVTPEDSWVLGDHDDNRLTLTACHPKYSAQQRIVVAAEMIDTPGAARPSVEEANGAVSLTDAETGKTIELASEIIPEELNSAYALEEERTLDEGLSWDTSPLPKALLFASITGLIFAVMLLGSRLWRRIPSYTIALLPLAVGLYFTFEQVDRILPAY
ncbi:MAG: class E sortase [Acidobacteria bacterium]|nr:class E sortase [Acidobacteriota bacterium]